MDGQSLEKDTGLKIIAACNPYKKHSSTLIANFEKSGLGFYMDMNETQVLMAQSSSNTTKVFTFHLFCFADYFLKEKLGDIPMRHLVYRVQPLPASMLPIVWDFGQLSEEVEKMYITQIVHDKFSRNAVALSPEQLKLIVDLLTMSQIFMRHEKNECNFVSLRDIQRVIQVIQWFLLNGQPIFEQMAIKKRNDRRKQQQAQQMSDDDEEDQTDNDDDNKYITSATTSQPAQQPNFIISLILALNTCYHVKLQDEKSRSTYRHYIATHLHMFDQQVTETKITKDIDYCYQVFLEDIQLPDAIAKNQALKENVFMMIMCVELNIPLFIIGKPGSSKSLGLYFWPCFVLYFV